MYNVAVEELKMAGERLPEMGHNIGVYIYSRWQPVYPVQTFNRNKFAATFDSFPAEPKGPTFLRQGLLKLEPILQQLSGKTVVFIFTDGQVTKFIGEKEPRVIAKELAEKYDVCFYLISSATSAQNQKMLNEVAKVNACSRVIPFEAFVGRPEYNSGALYLVKATEDIVTLMDRKVVEIVYHTMSRNKVTRRNVSPYKIWYSNGTFYVVGYCHRKKEIRVFAVDRIKMLTVTDETIEAPSVLTVPAEYCHKQAFPPALP